MPLPNFFLIGAMKSGTTSLYSYLGQHPEIFLSPDKEPRYFANEYPRSYYTGPLSRHHGRHKPMMDGTTYEALFEGSEGFKAVGEASAYYLASPVAAARIRKAVPHAKIIAILRNPADRAFSNYLHLRQVDREPLDDFGAALAEEQCRINNHWPFGWHYLHNGFYCDQLQRYYDHFPADQIQVHLFEDLCNDAVGLTRKIFRFLEVDDSYTPDTGTTLNHSGMPRNALLHWLFISRNPARYVWGKLLPRELRSRIRNRIYGGNLQKVAMDPGIRRQLQATYREDILRLETLIDRDLRHWFQ